jgi:lipopolysaccharide transport system permease protein
MHGRFILTAAKPFLMRQAIRQRSLIWQFVKRDVQSRYRGSWLGLGWSFLTPLLMLAVYTFVFREVFQSRWGQGNGGGVDFALRMYAGLVVFNFFAECVARAPRLIVDQPNLVKKVVFPLELLAWVSTFSGLFHLAVNAFVLLLAALVAGYGQPTMLLLPLVWLPLLPLVLGCSWFLASLGVYIRDIGQVIGLAISLLMFMSPIFYPVSAMPERWRFWLHLNPLTLIIENTRLVLLDGGVPNMLLLSTYFLVALLIAVLGGWWFQATRKGFADVL